MSENKFIVSSSPHLRSGVNTSSIMWNVVIALLPAWVVGIYYYGPRAIWLTLLSIIAAVITEFAIQAIRKVPFSALDGSAVITGMLLAFNVPPGVPWWMVIIGSVVGVAIGKQAFGGLGHNPLNPALVGRAFLMASWPVHMTTDWILPRGGSLSGAIGVDAVTSATPLTVLKLARNAILDPASSSEQIEAARTSIEAIYSSWPQMMIGNIGGCIGEISALAILLGGIFLIVRGFCDWRTPITYIAGVALLGWIFGGTQGFFTGNMLFQIFSGGLFLGAFFMATDMVTTPITKKGRWIFGLGCAVLTVFIRRWGGYPEGVSYSILIMNIFTPIIDRHTRPRIFGHSAKKAGQ
ncbi:RnfABCDGE type electron transport complex subunit D [bacterium]|nr:RnfABCDGE type electron transport complex subunit D [bacterium]